MARSTRDWSWGWLTALTPLAAALLLYACGRFESTDAADAGLDSATVGDATEEATAPDASDPPDGDTDAAPPQPTKDSGAPEAGCVYVGPGAGSASSSGCTSQELYSCNGTATSLTCTCPGQCECGATKLACPGSGCTITSTMRSKCGFPPPATD